MLSQIISLLNVDHNTDAEIQKMAILGKITASLGVHSYTIDIIIISIIILYLIC
jgi:hypothetical protein